MPYNFPLSRACLFSHAIFWLGRSWRIGSASVLGVSLAGHYTSPSCRFSAYACARSLFTSYLIWWFANTDGARICFHFWKRGSLATFATSCLLPSSFLHCTHSLSAVTLANCSHLLCCSMACRERKVHLFVPHCTAPSKKVPGCTVGFPRRNACVSCVNFPEQNDSCTLRNHKSLVRSHYFSSVTPWMPVSASSLHRRRCPCALLGVGEYVRAFRIYYTGMSPINPPSSGGSCQTSPLIKIFKPPNERCVPRLFCFERTRSTRLCA